MVIVLRMLSKFVGEDKFLKGVSLYLKKHLYSNTVSRNLWEGIGEATGKQLTWSSLLSLTEDARRA
jgi:aminopeptidase 2